MYKYSEFKEWVLSDEGQRAVIKALIVAQGLHAKAGSFEESKVTYGLASDSWKQLAIIDRLEELNCIEQIGNYSYRPRFYTIKE